MVTDTEALRAQFERQCRGLDLSRNEDGVYTDEFAYVAWIHYQEGYAAAKAEIADVGEPAAWCIPNDPCNATAFAWPGTDRTPQHNVPLFTADQLAAAADAEREKCAVIVNELRMECARRNMPESATMLWHAEDAIRAGAKEASDA